MLEVVDENGFQRGAIGQDVHSVIDAMAEGPSALSPIASDTTAAEDVRYHALLLLVYYSQLEDDDGTAAADLVDSYLRAFPYDTHADVLAEIRWTIAEFGSIAFY